MIGLDRVFEVFGYLCIFSSGLPYLFLDISPGVSLFHYISKRSIYVNRVKNTKRIVDSLHMESEFIAPSLEGYTVYSKSGCPFCVKVKDLLQTLGRDGTQDILLAIVDCDEYLRNDRGGFLASIREWTGGREWKTFPMVFLEGRFLGGYTETKSYLDRAMAFSF